MAHKQKKIISYALIFCMASGMLFSVSWAMAAVQSWNSATGNWFDAGEWAPNTAPSDGDFTNINNGGTAQVLGGNAATDILNIGNGGGNSGVFTIRNIGSTFTGDTIVPGNNNGTGTINILDGATFTTNTNLWMGVNGGTGTLNIENGGVINVPNSFFLGFNGGTGTLNIGNGGVVNMSGSILLGNTATSTTILNIGTGGAAGVINADSATLSVTGSCTINFNHTDANYYFTSGGTAGGTAFVITGNTAVNHLGTGTTILSGVNTYTGGTTVSAGTLTLQGGSALADTGAVSITSGTLDIDTSEVIGSLTGSGIVNLDANLTFGDTNSTSYTGVIQSTGQLIKTGTGTVTLSGANTYTGGTTVNAGTLQGTTTSLQGNITNNATVIFDQATTGTYAGMMSGTGSLIKSNTGTVILLGTNSYTGGTTVNAGTLQGTTSSLQGDITNNATVIFDQTTTGTYAGVMSGTGSLIKSNTGTVILSGTNTYTGTTTINGGTLLVNGSIGDAPITVNPGGTLGGSGTVVGSVYSWGVIAPGNSIGALTVDGNLVTRGTVKIEIDGASYDMLVVRGKLTIVGGKLELICAEGSYVKGGADYKFIQAASISGAFDEYASNNQSIVLSTFADGNTVFFIVERIGYLERLGIQQSLLSLSGQAAANSLSVQAQDAAGKMAEFIGGLDYLPNGDLIQLIEQVHGEKYDAFNENIFTAARIFSRDKQLRLKNLRNDDPSGLYFKLVRREENFDNLDNRTEFQNNIYGIEVGDDWVLGIN